MEKSPEYAIIHKTTVRKIQSSYKVFFIEIIAFVL